MVDIAAAVRADLAPTGKLRAGINYGHFILAKKDSATGKSSGVAIDLLQELARRLGVPLEIVAYDSVAVMGDAAPTFELFLGRNLKYAQLVSTQGGSAAFDLLAAGKVDALAGLTQGLLDLVEKLPGSRVLDGRFMGVQQAIAVPKGRRSGLDYLRRVVEEVKVSGLVARAIERTGVRGISVAPLAD